jgi:signal peptidase II
MATGAANPPARNRLLRIVAPVLLTGVLADQASKSWASLRAAEPRVLVPGYLAAYAVPNAGAVLGLGRDQARTNPAFALLGLACAGLLARLAYSDHGRWRGADWLAGALVLAGVVGNTADRLALGHVRDFLVSRAAPTVAFNVADLLVVVGGACLLMARYHGGRRSRPGVGVTAWTAAR